MVKSVLGVSHLGLRDWLIQRITAIFMVAYTVGMVVFFMRHPDLAYYEWHGLFNSVWVKVATLLFMLCLLAHAWIGVWTVLTDYIKPFVVRFCFYVVILVGLIALFFQTLLIIWGI